MEKKGKINLKNIISFEERKNCGLILADNAFMKYNEFRESNFTTF